MDLAQPLGLLGWRDLVDLLVVGLVVYNLLLLIRGTGGRPHPGRHPGAGRGGVDRGAASPGHPAGLAELSVCRHCRSSSSSCSRTRSGERWPRVGRNPLLRLTTDQTGETWIEEVVVAAQALSVRKLGALVVVERIDGLRDYAENGIVLDAAVSHDLLLTIFARDTPLHDGAVIVQKDRIAAAACFLPADHQRRRFHRARHPAPRRDRHHRGGRTPWWSSSRRRRAGSRSRRKVA